MCIKILVRIKFRNIRVDQKSYCLHTLQYILVNTHLNDQILQKNAAYFFSRSYVTKARLKKFLPTVDNESLNVCG